MGQHHFDFIPLLFARAGEKRCVVNVLRFFWYKTPNTPSLPLLFETCRTTKNTRFILFQEGL